MNILIIGNGGREYAIGLSLKNDKKVKKLFFAPGNGATSNLGENISISDFEELASFAQDSSIDLTIVGPEAPLVAGIVDVFKAKNLKIFGPSKKAARLEGSKVFMKNFLSKYNIPTAKYIESSNYEELSSFIETLKEPIVVKADGLCAGKGVIIAPTKEEAREATKSMLSGESFGDAGKKVIIEEFLDGYELSLFAICDGEDYILLPAAQDHKKLENEDKGPNTGGMGAYAPTPLVNDGIYEDVKTRVIEPTLKGMQEEKSPFHGVLFIGLMVVGGEIYVLEYNVRFGDPECEVLLPLLKSSSCELFDKAASGDIKKLEVAFYNEFVVGVVIASENYPYKNSTPSEIIVDKIVHEKLEEKSHIAYAGVSREEETLFAHGGRVLVCVGRGESIQVARDRAYMLCGQVHFAGKKFRTDIAYQALKQC